MDTEAIRAVIDQYARHDWQLRRALMVSLPPRPDIAELIAGAAIEESQINALWFSRRSVPDAEAWELRRLDGTPFALLAVIPDDASEDEKEAMLAETEDRMAEAAGRSHGH